MRIETSINLIPEQPGDANWSSLRRIAGEWNRSHPEVLEDMSGIMFQLRVPDIAMADLAEIRILIDRLRTEAGVRAYAASRRIYSEQDYDEAAFVEIAGVGLDRPGRPFVLNREEALGPPAACSECGWQDIFNAPQTEPFTIEESFLDDAALDDAAAGGDAHSGGWDCAALPAGRLLVSTRLLGALRRADIRGLEVRPVRAKGTGRDYDRAFQISAERAVLVPCPADEPGNAYCSACGAAVDAPEHEETADPLFAPQVEFQVSHSQFAGVDMLSRHPSRAAMLYFAQRIYKATHQHRFNGVGRGEIIRFRHGS